VERRLFTKGRDAIKALVKYARECLEIGGLPMVRTEYAGVPFRYREDGAAYRGVIILCYGRAQYLPALDVFAPESDREWRELVGEFEKYAGDYRILLWKYGGLVPEEEVERQLVERLGRELVEKLRAAPLIPRVG